MEILTYVLEGALAHRDSLGHFAVARAGELQRMTAGTGVTHSEYNHSDEVPVHFLQIWILPEAKGLAPSHEHRTLPRHPGFVLAASRDGREGALRLHQDAEIHVAGMEAGDAADFPLRSGRHAWLHVARGGLEVNGRILEAGDAVAATGENRLRVRAATMATLIIFDLP
jgi:hypothetical protein